MPTGKNHVRNDWRHAFDGFPVSRINPMHRRSDYHPPCIGPSNAPSKPDISPDQRWSIPMKNLILAAFAALSLTAVVAPIANAAVFHSTVAGNAAATRMVQTGSFY